MEHTDTRIDGITIAYIGGGSRGWAWNLMGDLALEGRLSGLVRLYDIDADAAAANARIGTRLSASADTNPAVSGRIRGRWAYETAPDLASALTGADFVIISILPGTFEDMAVDVHAPEGYGIWQSVGDTTGPGGLMRALRTIPMYETIARAIRDYAPTAWVLNYTNPMALCVRTLYEVFPGIKAFGCCHEVFGTRRLLAAVAREELGIADARMEDVAVNVFGINHFTWLDAASCGTQDLFPAYRSFVEKHVVSGYEGVEGESWLNSYFASAERVKFDLFRRFGLIAAAGDRHLAEFMPPWYLADPATVASWKFSLTPVSWRISNAARLRERSQRLASGAEAFIPKASGEEGVGQIAALLGLEPLVTNMNLPNQGQVANLPQGAVVETNALITRDSVRPVMAGSLPSSILGHVARHVANQSTILDAALHRDAQTAFPAFMNDPLVDITLTEGEELFATMLEGTGRHFEGWKV